MKLFSPTFKSTLHGRAKVRSQAWRWWTRIQNASKSAIIFPWHKIQKRHSASPEEPKELLVKGFGSSVLQCSVHLLPLGITAFVLQLNFRNVYWGFIRTANLNALLDAFQFAAKLYEVLICASLVSMTIHMSRLRLSDTGVPLGSLISSYDINKVSCLWSSAFWAGLFASPTRSLWQHRLCSLMLGLSLILTAIVGPCTAIALIPRVDWWPVYLSGYAPSIHTAAPISQIWPKRLSESNIPNIGCLSPDATGISLCPVAGYLAILNQLSGVFPPININLTIPIGNAPGVPATYTLKAPGPISALVLKNLMWW